MSKQLSQGTQLLTQLSLLGGNQQFIFFKRIFQLLTELLLPRSLGFGFSQFSSLIGLVFGEAGFARLVFPGLGHLALLDKL